MIGFLKERIIGARPKVNRAQVLAARPIRNPLVKWEREPRTGGDEGEAEVILLRIPRRQDRFGNFIARMFRLPDFRKLELDEIGSDVWERCDGTTTVEALTKAVCDKYRLNRRQAETSVTTYLRMLAERRLIALRTTGGGAAATAAKAKGKGGAAARRPKRA